MSEALENLTAAAEQALYVEDARRIHRYSAAELQVLMAGFRRECCDFKIHMYVLVHFIYGRKPQHVFKWQRVKKDIMTKCAMEYMTLYVFVVLDQMKTRTRRVLCIRSKVGYETDDGLDAWIKIQVSKELDTVARSTQV